jgi:hypothetical protein
MAGEKRAHDNEGFEQRKKERQAVVIARTQNMSSEESRTYLDTLCRRWKLSDVAGELTFQDAIDMAFENFGLDATGDVDLTDVGSFGIRALDERIHEHEMELIAMYHVLKSHGHLDDAAVVRKIMACFEQVYYGKRLVLNAFQAKLGAHQLHLADEGADHTLDEDTEKLLGSWSLRFRWVDDETNPVQKLLLHMLDRAMERKYRRQNDWCFEPVLVDGYDTHAWRGVMTIREWMYTETRKETNWEQWLWMTSGTSAPKAVEEYLRNCVDYSFPELRKDRTTFAFRNGVYRSRDNAFYPHAGSTLPGSIAACKYFDREFPDELVHDDVDPRDIPTPHFESIMNYQGWEPEVKVWMYTLLGRLLYSVGQLDSWQVIPFVKGQASSGKCFAAGTRVLMASGYAARVEDLVPGDLVMGDDSTPRRIGRLARGEAPLYTVCTPYATFRVTEEHVLCLVDAAGRRVEMTVGEYLKTSHQLPDVGNPDRGYRMYSAPGPVEFAGARRAFFADDAYRCGVDVVRGLHDPSRRIPLDVLTSSVEERAEVFRGITDAAGSRKRIANLGRELAEDVARLARSLGYLARVQAGLQYAVVVDANAPYVFDVLRNASEQRPEPYYGFETDGNRRFLLADFTVTHNSTITLKVAKEFYDDIDVGCLSNNIETRFGLSQFYDKLLFVAPEIKSDLKIEQAEFQSIVSGEQMTINIKNKTAISTDWNVPGILAGNEVPSWCDNSGSIQRRIVLFDFPRQVTNGDMKLGEKLSQELPYLLLKCNRLYLQAVSKWSHTNIWTVLPDYFIHTRNEMAQATNVLEAFLGSEDVVLREDAYVSMDDFKAALKTFAQHNNFGVKRFTWEYFRGPFDKFGITKTRSRKVYQGKHVVRDFLMGIEITATAEENLLG